MRATLPLASVLLLGWTSACGPTQVPRFKKGTPEVLEAPANLPLTPTLSVVLNQPATLQVRLSDERGTRVLHLEAEQQVHEIPLLGLRPRDEVEVTVTAIGRRGSAEARPVQVEVGRLPRRFPLVDVLHLAPELREPGLTVMAVELVSDDEELPYLVALDSDRHPVWVWRTDLEHGDLRWLESGSLYALGGGVAWELSPAGVVLGQWGNEREEPAKRRMFTAVDTGSLHHELFPVDGASSFWSLVDSPFPVDDYPCSYAAPAQGCGPDTLTDARVVQFDRDGTVVNDWSLASRLDPFRIGYDALPVPDEHADWSHANAVIERPEGGVLVSVRHQDALVALDEQGAVEWILAEPEGWDPELEPYLLQAVGDPFAWPYHAHGPAYDDEGVLWVFDNHNHGTSPYSGPSSNSTHSRVVGYAIDAANRTVSQVASLEQTATGSLFSRALGNATVLPTTGNLLGHYGMPTAEDGVPHKELGFGSRAIRLVEWTRDGQLASDVRLRSDVDDEPKGWKGYRAAHAPSLYGAGVEEWIEGEP